MTARRGAGTDGEEAMIAGAVVIGGGASGRLLVQALAGSRWGRGRRVVLADPRTAGT